LAANARAVSAEEKLLDIQQEMQELKELMEAQTVEDKAAQNTAKIARYICALSPVYSVLLTRTFPQWAYKIGRVSAINPQPTLIGIDSFVHRHQTRIVQLEAQLAETTRVRDEALAQAEVWQENRNKWKRWGEVMALQAKQWEDEVSKAKT
jgi:pyruvate-formate lyase